jgi:hypothetical protein
MAGETVSGGQKEEGRHNYSSWSLKRWKGNPDGEKPPWFK